MQLRPGKYTVMQYSRGAPLANHHSRPVITMSPESDPMELEVAAVGNPNNNNNIFTIAMNGVPINQGDDGLCFGYEGDSGDPWEIKEAPLRDGWQVFLPGRKIGWAPVMRRVNETPITVKPIPTLQESSDPGEVMDTVFHFVERF